MFGVIGLLIISSIVFYLTLQHAIGGKESEVEVLFYPSVTSALEGGGPSTLGAGSFPAGKDTQYLF
jgi:hypothetical protein